MATNIASLVSTATSPATSNTATAVTGDSGVKATIAGNFNTFLQLLTTQLKNQNPLDPLDTNQFTQQLVQFASGRAADQHEHAAHHAGVAAADRRRTRRR